MATKTILAMVLRFMLGVALTALSANRVMAQAERICISEIQVTGESDGIFGPRLEVEVHMFESGTNFFLGCSGYQSGLICANESNVFYQVEAYFQKPAGGFVTYDDIKGRTIYLQAIEDDDNPCPGPIVSGDDHIGTSNPFPGSNLQTPQVMSFGRVTHLKISKAMNPPPRPNSPRISIHEIMLGNSSSSFSDLEVHVYDAGTNLFLGCAGGQSGMAKVELPDSLYHVQAFFQRPVRGDRELTYDDVKDRNLFLVVIDDYEDMCPCQHDRFDGSIGRSNAFAGSILKTPQVMQFGNVTRLLLCVDSTAAVRPEVAPSQITGAEFRVDVAVDSMPDIFKLDVEMSYTHTDFLDVVSVVPGPLLGSEVDFTSKVDEAAGKVSISLSRKPGQAGVTGSGVAARIQFKSLASTTPGTLVVFSVSKASAKNSAGNALPLTLSCGTTTTVIGAPSAPALASPLDGATEVSTSPTFSWNPAIGATSYRLQVATDANFTKRVIDQRGITSASYSGPRLADTTTYYWRVNARNAAGTSAWSTVWYFKTGISAPVAPLLASPAFGAVNQPTLVTLSWNPSARATTYRLQVSTSFDFSTTVVDDDTITSTSRQVGPLASNTTYYWRVNARNTGGTSEWSVTWRFTTLVTSVQAREEIPSEFGLGQNYPNPFNPSTTIAFSLPQPGRVTLKVFNHLGEEITTLLDQDLDLGRHQVIWETNGVASGVYFYRLYSEGRVLTRKMILMR